MADSMLNSNSSKAYHQNEMSMNDSRYNGAYGYTPVLKTPMVNGNREPPALLSARRDYKRSMRPEQTIKPHFNILEREKFNSIPDLYPIRGSPNVSMVSPKYPYNGGIQTNNNNTGLLKTSFQLPNSSLSKSRFSKHTDYSFNKSYSAPNLDRNQYQAMLDRIIPSSIKNCKFYHNFELFIWIKTMF